MGRFWFSHDSKGTPKLSAKHQKSPMGIFFNLDLSIYIYPPPTPLDCPKCVPSFKRHFEILYMYMMRHDLCPSSMPWFLRFLRQYYLLNNLIQPSTETCNVERCYILFFVLIFPVHNLFFGLSLFYGCSTTCFLYKKQHEKTLTWTFLNILLILATQVFCFALIAFCKLFY